MIMKMTVFIALMVEAGSTSETSVNFYQTMQQPRRQSSSAVNFVDCVLLGCDGMLSCSGHQHSSKTLFTTQKTKFNIFTTVRTSNFRQL
jgi:hypothetical protein